MVVKVNQGSRKWRWHLLQLLWSLSPLHWIACPPVVPKHQTSHQHRFGVHHTCPKYIEGEKSPLQLVIVLHHDLVEHHFLPKSHRALCANQRMQPQQHRSMIEREENRFVYRIRCSSDENNEEEEMEEGIGISWASECRWLLLEEPLRFFDGYAIWEIFSKFQSVEMKENEKRWNLGFEGSDLDKKWVSYGKKKNWEWGFREREWVVSDFWFRNLNI